jgi:hypothetical protein
MGRAQTRRKGARSGSWSSSGRVLRVLVGVTRPLGGTICAPAGSRMDDERPLHYSCEKPTGSRGPLSI